LFLNDFEGVVGLLFCGLACFSVGYGDCAVFGCDDCFWVKS
jgi:hypothetical protein